MENETSQNINKKTERNSNFEWLRIIAMIMIIFHHYCVHGYIDTTNASFLHKVLYSFFISYGKLGVVIFVMLSGYFSCKSKFNLKRLILLLVETIFYSVVWYIIACLVGEDAFDTSSLITSFSVLFYSKYWFFTCYIGLSLIAPLLNILLQNLSRKQHFIVCLVGGIIYSFVSSFSEYLYWNELIYFMYLYIVAAYIRLYNGKHNIKFDIFGLIITFVLAWGIRAINVYLLKRVFDSKLIFQPFLLQSTTNLFIGIFLICICKKIKPRSSKFVNYIAASSFGVYLIHERYVYFLWVKLFKNDIHYAQSFIVFGLHMLITVIIVYVCATIIDIIRRELLERYFSKIYDFCYKKINNSKFVARIKLRLNNLDD